MKTLIIALVLALSIGISPAYSLERVFTGPAIYKEYHKVIYGSKRGYSVINGRKSILSLTSLSNLREGDVIIVMATVQVTNNTGINVGISTAVKLSQNKENMKGKNVCSIAASYNVTANSHHGLLNRMCMYIVEEDMPGRNWLKFIMRSFSDGTSGRIIIHRRNTSMAVTVKRPIQ